MFRGILPLLLLTALTTACSTRTLGPGHKVEEGIEMRLSIRPVEVRLHQPFTAHVSVTNRRSHTVTLVSRHSCVARFALYSGEQLTPVSGTDRGCHVAITQHTLRPGQSMRRVLPIWAESPNGGSIAQGEYLLRAIFSTEVFEINGIGVTLPDLEHRLVIR